MHRVKRMSLLAAAVAVAPAWATVSSTTVSFRNGVNGYAGAFDMLVSTSAGSDGLLGSATPSYYLDGFRSNSPDSQKLLRFDGIFGAGPGQIPLGATILSASLDLTTNGLDPATDPPGDSNAHSDGPFGVSNLLLPFDASTRYIDFGVLGPTFRNGSTTLINTTRPVAGFGDYRNRFINGDETVDADVTALVQRWASGEANHGFSIHSGREGTSNGWQVNTSGYPVVERRPQLTVTYTTDPVSVATFQQGVNGYAGTTMSWLRQNNNVSSPLDGSVIDQAFLDGPNGSDSPDDRALIRFDNIFASQGGSVPDGAEIVDAFLVLTTGFASNSARSVDGWDLHRMLVEWDQDAGSPTPSFYSDFGGGFGPQVGSDMSDVLRTLDGMNTDSQAWFDITQSIKDFQSGAVPNYGFSIKSTALLDAGLAASDGWQINFTGATQVDARPQLYIRFKASEASWAFDTDGNWSEGANWTTSAAPGGAGARAILGNVVTTARTVTLDVDVTLDALTVDSGGGSYVLDSSGAARLTVNRLAVDAGRLDLDDSSGNRAAVKANAASIAAGATLNLKGGALVVDYAAEASPLGDLAALALAGALTADAGGVGIVEASALGATSFGGVSVDADAVLVAGTFRGDTNLDGQVDVSDLGNLASGWQQPGGWLNGDFNYDGTVDVSDLGDLATNWQAGVTGPLAPEASLPRALIAAGLGSAGLGGVIPEPASLSLLALGALAIRRRR